VDLSLNLNFKGNWGAGAGAGDWGEGLRSENGGVFIFNECVSLREFVNLILKVWGGGTGTKK
jgi:hypothetical protein